MADIQDTAWSEVADQNSAAAPNGWPEGMNRRDVNNAAREMMGALKRWWNRTHATREATSGGTDTYSVTYTVNPTSLSQGLTIAFRADADSKANAKLKVGSLTAANLRKQVFTGLAALQAGDVRQGQVVVAVYDSAAGAFVVINQIAGTASGGVDYGEVKITARVGGSTERGFPSGWMLCDGRTLSRTTYAGLFAAIGVTYGSGDGSTTFNIPDARGRALLGADRFLLFGHHEGQQVGGRLTGNPTPGSALGSETTALGINHIPSHTHAGLTASAGEHGHVGTTSGVGDHTHGGATDAAGQHQHTGQVDQAGEHTHLVNQNISGAGFGGFGFTGNAPWGQVTASETTISGNHTHTFTTLGAGQHTHSLATYGAGAHSHDLFITPNGAHTHALSINNTGGGEAHTNLQPSLCLNVLIYTGVHA